MGSKVSKTLRSEDVSKNCAFFSIPQTSTGDPDKVKSMANTRVIVDTLVGSHVFGTSPHEGIARNMIDSYRVLVYTLTFTQEEYKKYGRVLPDDAFTAENVIVSFLVILKGTREIKHLATYLAELKTYLKDYNRSYEKLMKRNQGQLAELKAFVRGDRWNQSMTIYELSVLGVDRADVEKLEVELGEVNQDFPRFDPDTTSIRHFTSRDSKILYIFADALQKECKTKKRDLVYENYKGYISDGVALSPDAPYYDLYLSSRSPDDSSTGLGVPRAPGTIILVREKHLNVTRARVRKRIEKLMEGRQKQIVVEDLFVFEALHSFCDTYEYRSTKTITSDMFLLSEEGKVLVNPRAYSVNITTVSSWMNNSSEFNIHKWSQIPAQDSAVETK